MAKLTAPRQNEQLIFRAPRQVAVEPAPWPEPEPDEVVVRSLVSAISAGTEMLVYRGEMPAELATDATIAALAQPFHYPTAYGYAVAGVIHAVGKAVDKWQVGQPIFAFHPHQHFFKIASESIWAIPAAVSSEESVFLPNMETAVSFVMDGQPVIGENVLVLGQGIVGLLTTGLLAELPLASLATVDRLPLRRATSLSWGATHSVENSTDLSTTCGELGFDLAYELTGQPAVLNAAVALTGYTGRVVIGSWYGQKAAPLTLGGHFHRSHMQLISSQVSTLHPRWRGRWDKLRRLAVAWQMIARLRPARLITHRFPLAEAATAYDLLDRHSEAALQVVLTYD